MWSSRASLGVAQIVFYIPAAPAAIYLATRHGRPRLAWVFMAVLSFSQWEASHSVRLAGGALLIVGGVYEQDPNAVDFFIVYDVLLQVGFYQLLLSTVALLMIV